MRDMADKEDKTEWVEEEHIVMVELSGVLDYEYFTKSANECKILGIETENPLLQIGNYIFKGEYRRAIGTMVFFEQDENSGDWEYRCLTDKKLEMKRVFLQPHVPASTGEQQMDTSSEMEADDKAAGT